MEPERWRRENLAAIRRRLEWLRGEPDGTLHDERTSLHHIRVIKHAGQVQLYFVEPDGQLAGPMSRIELDRPLHLVAGYTQAAVLGLLWNPAPQRVCVLGFAGGRLPLVLHHHLAQTRIDSVDLDPAVGPIAERFFGVAFDDRQRLFAGDARAFLEAADATYDVVVMDAFRDGSDNLDHLATQEFYELCRSRLAPSGVLCVNLLHSDPRFGAKLATFAASFRYVYLVEQRRSLILLGSERGRLPPGAVVGRAAELQRRYGFDFPLAEQAARLRQYRRDVLGHGGPVELLRDGAVNRPPRA